MGKKSSPAPPAPVKIDPRETAEAQYEFGQKTALYNKQLAESTSQQTPYGTLNYEVMPTTRDGVPQTRMVQALHPAEQALLDQQRQLKGQYGSVAGQLMDKASGLYSTPIDMSRLGAMPVADQTTRQSTIDSILGRFQPQQARSRSALETQLANQGFTRGTESWQSSMDEINRRENDLMMAANIQAGNEMRADVAQQLGARQQSLQELLTPRNQTLQELSTFMTGSQPTTPQFAPVSAPQVSTPDYAGLAATSAQMQNQANMNAYNAQMQNQGDSGLGSLLGTAAGFAFGGPIGASIGGSLGGSLGGGGGSGGVSTFSGALPGGATSSGGWSF